MQTNKTDIARFGMGCFWHPDDYFSKLDGVIKTRVGYAGGNSKNPTYEDLNGHTETIEIEFDPDKISYQELLEKFWQQHDPTQEQKTQYRSVIFAMDESQQKAAQDSKRSIEQELGKPVTTAIEPAGPFYQAEAYHQKYYDKLRAKGAM